MFPHSFRVQHEALQKVESEQNEFIEQFILQKWMLILRWENFSYLLLMVVIINMKKMFSVYSPELSST